MNAFLIFILIITLAYLFIISLLTIGWYNLKEYRRTFKQPETKVSIIIPVRNEETNIEHCLKDLIRQDYPSELFEIIIIDDDSSDNTVKQIEYFIKNNSKQNIKLLFNKSFNDSSGKKSAITNSINIANGKLIITSDADCRFGNSYISTIADYYENYKPKMILGPVGFDNEQTFFQKLQSLEFLSLIASSAAAIKTPGPLMCNGANLAYEKEAFISTGGFKNNLNYASGDDMFLMLNIHKQFPGSIHFIKNKDVIVHTDAKKTPADFIEQRKRWVSKTKAYSVFRVIIISLVIFLFNFSIAGIFIAAFFSCKLFLLALILFVIKSVIDFPILKGVSGFMNRKHLLKYFILLQIIYIFYVPFIAVAGNISGYRWKDRKFKN